MEQHESSVNSYETTHWKFFGFTVCKNEVVYFCQTFILYVIIIVCLGNLSLGNGHSQTWTSLLAASLCYLLPNPSIKQKTITVHKYCNHI